MEALRCKVINQRLYWLTLAALLASFFVFGINHLEGFAWDYDEGLNLIKAKMVRAGYPLYSEIWSDQPPAFTLLLVLAFNSLGESVVIGRSVSVFFATIGLLGVTLAARRVSGNLSAVAAVLMLASSPHFFELSRAVMLDLPAMSLATLSIALALYHLSTGKQHWLILAGLVFSISLLVKVITTFILLPLGFIVLLRAGEEHGPRLNLIKNLRILALTIILPFMLCLLICDDRALIDQTFGTYLQSRALSQLNIAENGQRIWGYLSHDKYGLSHYGLLGLAILGIVALLRKRVEEGTVVIAWLILTLLVLLVHAPLRRHHLVILLFPLTILGGAGVDYFKVHLSHFPKWIPFQWALLLFGLSSLGFYFLELPDLLRVNQGLLAAPEEDKAAWAAVRFVADTTAPSAFIVTDNPMIPFRADRRVPPSLCVPSVKRIVTGDLETETLLGVTQEYSPPLIVLWKGRLDRFPAYMDWMIQHYRVAQYYSEGRQIYVPFDPTAIQHVQKVNLKDHLVFLGYSIDRLTVEPGETLSLTLYWKAREPVIGDYTVFVHLLDRENRIWGRVDNVPLRGTYPTHHWLPGETIVDEYEIAIHPDASEGQHILEVGMYDVYTQKRLPIYGEDGEQLEDRIVLKTPVVVGGEDLFASLEDIQHPVRFDLGDEVAFLGCSLAEKEIEPGAGLHLTLYWQARERMDTDYTVFVHLVGEDNQIWGQKDGFPVRGRYPTTGWLVGKIVADHYEIEVAPDTPPGEYRIEVGMYLLETMERLAVFDENGQRLPDDRILLSEIRVGG